MNAVWMAPDVAHTRLRRLVTDTVIVSGRFTVAIRRWFHTAAHLLLAQREWDVLIRPLRGHLALTSAALGIGTHVGILRIMLVQRGDLAPIMLFICVDLEDQVGQLELLVGVMACPRLPLLGGLASFGGRCFGCKQ